ncbi:hypothetical protein BCR34DRAFT_607620 [Clohesyomyces aquaticus]|uniref:C3H1-type domain-containing protein n=1 Tax=Clohesyomyces aquaticus TaxID=1231657 RepID=A0A1Y1YFW9_9PLEO|nr:hypothetical protein BCR34DRAFT_607620 [Clohesyomyces aquaticus]
MAQNHVPSDHLTMSTQSIYNDPSFENLYPTIDQFGAHTWNSSQIGNPGAGFVQQGHPSSSAPVWPPNSFPQQTYNAIGHGYSNPSPYQYGQFGNHTPPVASYAHSPVLDPALVDPLGMRRGPSPYQLPSRHGTPQGQSGTVAPQALQQNATAMASVNALKSVSSFQPKNTTEMFSQRASSTPMVMQQQHMQQQQMANNPRIERPKGAPSGGFILVPSSTMAKATNSVPLNKYVTIGSQQVTIPLNRSALPQYNARCSVHDLKKLGDKKVLAKISKKSASSKTYRLNTILGSKTGAGGPSTLKRETSDSDTVSDSDDSSSDYSSDDEEEEISPLPAARPEGPAEAVRYDVIKATWHPRRSAVGTQKVKDSLSEFWKVLSPIQKRWRMDSNAVKEAEDQKNTGELPVLKSRVASQRDLLEAALKTALELGHPDIIYNLGKIKPFSYLCYMFMANRHKVKDYNGPLSSLLYEILHRCKDTLTTEFLEETKLVRALKIMKKDGANDKNKRLIDEIIDGAAANSEKLKGNSPPKDESIESKDGKRPVTEPSVAKKPNPSAPTTGPVKKTTLVAPGSKATPASAAPLQKRPGAGSAVGTVKAHKNQVVNKPSTFFSTLNAVTKKPTTASTTTATAKAASQPKASAAATKKPVTVAPAKPGFSFAATMASLLTSKEEPEAPPKPEKQLPPETEEEKKRRLRKESRRHLRVQFRPDASLVDIRLFNHDPEEELGHDENFVRDAGDIGGEGRMFKQHKEKDMDYDDDDDEPEQSYRDWIDPTYVDFSRVDLDERKRNYEPFGGGMMKVISPETEANKLRENSTLMVFYSHPSDIPASPREPLESTTEESTNVTEFGQPPDWVLQRSPNHLVVPPTQTADFSSLEAIFRQHALPQTAAPVAPAPAAYAPPQPAAAPDLSAILGALSAAAQQQAPAQAPALQPPVAAQPPAFDLAALLANVAAANPGVNFPPPPTAPWPFAQPFQQPQPQAQPQQQQNTAGFLQTQPSQRNQQASGGTKRWRSEEDNHESGRGGFKKAKGHKNRFNNERQGDAPHNVPHKVIPCRFFQKGQCAKGDECTFIHDLNFQ